MNATFVDPSTGKGWLEGQTYKRNLLADTLEMLAVAGDTGDELFYEGSIAEMLVGDLQDRGGIITMEDMLNYQVDWQVNENNPSLKHHQVYFNPIYEF